MTSECHAYSPLYPSPSSKKANRVRRKICLLPWRDVRAGQVLKKLFEVLHPKGVYQD